MRQKLACCLALLIFFGNSFPVAAKVEQAFESFENVHRESYTIEPLLRSYSEGYVLLISTTEDESGNVIRQKNDYKVLSNIVLKGDKITGVIYDIEEKKDCYVLIGEGNAVSENSEVINYQGKVTSHPGYRFSAHAIKDPTSKYKLSVSIFDESNSAITYVFDGKTSFEMISTKSHKDNYLDLEKSLSGGGEYATVYTYDYPAAYNWYISGWVTTAPNFITLTNPPTGKTDKHQFSYRLQTESNNVKEQFEKDYGWVSVAGVNNLKLTLHETTYTYCTLLSPQESGEQGFTIFAYLPTIGFVSTDVVTSYTRVSTSGKTPTVELGWGSLKGYLDDNLNNEKTFGVNFEYGIINSLGLVGYGQWGNIQNPVTTELTYEVMVQLYPGDPSVGFEYPTYRNVKNYPIWVYRP